MAKTTVITLGDVQAELERATRELKSAQSNFLKASARLQNAEEAHNTAMIELANTASAVRAKARVVPIALK